MSSHGLVEEREEYKWDAKCQVAFQKLKDAITSELVLRPLDLDFSFEVHTDASNRALKGVLV